MSAHDRTTVDVRGTAYEISDSKNRPRAMVLRGYCTETIEEDPGGEAERVYHPCRNHATVRVLSRDGSFNDWCHHHIPDDAPEIGAGWDGDGTMALSLTQSCDAMKHHDGGEPVMISKTCGAEASLRIYDAHYQWRDVCLRHARSAWKDWLRADQNGDDP